MDQADSITIQPKDQLAIKEIQEAIKRERLLLASLENMLVSLLEKKYGVDLANDHWELNVDEGTVTRMENTNGPTP